MNGPLDSIIGRQPLVALLPGFDVLDFDLHVSAAAAADVYVIAFQHAPDFLVELEQITDTDFGRENLCHWSPDLIRKAGEPTIAGRRLLITSARDYRWATRFLFFL